jgi:hypothetical protein
MSNLLHTLHSRTYDAYRFVLKDSGELTTVTIDEFSELRKIAN